MACACSNPALALDKRAMLKQHEREQRAASKRRLAELRAELRRKKKDKRARLAAVKAHCRAERVAAGERVRMMREAARLEASERAARMRADARSSCVVERDAVAIDLERAKAAVEAEKKRQAEARSQARAERIWSRSDKSAPRSSARTRRSESDDEVRANLPPEYLGAFERVRRQIKGSARKSRTEAFLEWLEEHPEEVFAGIDDQTDAMIAAHERELRRAAENPRHLLDLSPERVAVEKLPEVTSKLEHDRDDEPVSMDHRRELIVRWNLRDNEARAMHKWLREARSALGDGYAWAGHPAGKPPSDTAPPGDRARWLVRAAEELPALPKAVETYPRPWSTPHGSGALTSLYDAGDGRVAEVSRRTNTDAIPVVAELADFGVALRSLKGKKRTAAEAKKRAAAAEGRAQAMWYRIAEWLEAAPDLTGEAGAREHARAEAKAAEKRRAEQEAEVFEFDAARRSVYRLIDEKLGRAELEIWPDPAGHRALIRQGDHERLAAMGPSEAVALRKLVDLLFDVPKREARDWAAKEVLRAVEDGPSHALAVVKAPFWPNDPGVTSALRRGWIRKLEPRGRWPERYVVTAAGSHELGTFASDDATFRDDARAAGEVERARREAERAKPEGYGVEERGRKRGQLRMFNPPRPGARNPSGGAGLVLLGRLTALDYLEGGRRRALRWAYRSAPLLAYDGAGRLHVVYGRSVVGRASSAERREYARTHWGKAGRGEVIDGQEARAPFDVLGVSTSITYTTEKGADRELVDYVHEWGEGARGAFTAPTVVAHRCSGGRCPGRGLVAISGGSYRVTERGIVG